MDIQDLKSRLISKYGYHPSAAMYNDIDPDKAETVGKSYDELLNKFYDLQMELFDSGVTKLSDVYNELVKREVDNNIDSLGKIYAESSRSAYNKEYSVMYGAAYLQNSAVYDDAFITMLENADRLTSFTSADRSQIRKTRDVLSAHGRIIPGNHLRAYTKNALNDASFDSLATFIADHVSGSPVNDLVVVRDFTDNLRRGHHNNARRNFNDMEPSVKESIQSTTYEAIRQQPFNFRTKYTAIQSVKSDITGLDKDIDKAKNSAVVLGNELTDLHARHQDATGEEKAQLMRLIKLRTIDKNKALYEAQFAEEMKNNLLQQVDIEESMLSSQLDKFRGNVEQLIRDGLMTRDQAMDIFKNMSIYCGTMEIPLHTAEYTRIDDDSMIDEAILQRESDIECLEDEEYDDAQELLLEYKALVAEANHIRSQELFLIEQLSRADLSSDEYEKLSAELNDVSGKKRELEGKLDGDEFNKNTLRDRLEEYADKGLINFEKHYSHDQQASLSLIRASERQQAALDAKYEEEREREREILELEAEISGSYNSENQTLGNEDKKLSKLKNDVNSKYVDYMKNEKDRYMDEKGYIKKMSNRDMIKKNLQLDREVKLGVFSEISKSGIKPESVGHALGYALSMLWPSPNRVKFHADSTITSVKNVGSDIAHFGRFIKDGTRRIQSDLSPQSMAMDGIAMDKAYQETCISIKNDKSLTDKQRENRLEDASKNYEANIKSRELVMKRYRIDPLKVQQQQAMLIMDLQDSPDFKYLYEKDTLDSKIIAVYKNGTVEYDDGRRQKVNDLSVRNGFKYGEYTEAPAQKNEKTGQIMQARSEALTQDVLSSDISKQYDNMCNEILGVDVSDPKSPKSTGEHSAEKQMSMLNLISTVENKRRSGLSATEVEQYFKDIENNETLTPEIRYRYTQEEIRKVLDSTSKFDTLYDVVNSDRNSELYMNSVKESLREHYERVEKELELDKEITKELAKAKEVNKDLQEEVSKTEEFNADNDYESNDQTKREEDQRDFYEFLDSDEYNNINPYDDNDSYDR